MGNASLMCEEKADRGALDEACVIEIAKAEIAARLHGARYSKYKVRFNAQDRHWVVMAYNEHGPPDSHVFLKISPEGKVEQVGNRE